MADMGWIAGVLGGGLWIWIAVDEQVYNVDGRIQVRYLELAF